MSVVMNRLGRLLLALGALTACGPERGEDGGDGAPGWMVGTFSNRWPGFARTDLGLWDIRADGTIDQTYVSQCGDYERPGEPLRFNGAHAQSRPAGARPGNRPDKEPAPAPA